MGRVSNIPPPPTSSDDPAFGIWTQAVTTRLNELPHFSIFTDVPITEATTVANTTTETTIFTEPLDPRETSAGSLIELHILGRYSTANATDTFTIRFKIGGNTIASAVSAADNVTNAPIRASFVMTFREGGPNGRVIGFVDLVSNNTHDDQANTSETTVDLSIVELLEVTIEWDAADPGDTVTIDQAFISAEE